MGPPLSLSLSFSLSLFLVPLWADPLTKEQGWIHGQYQLRMGGQGRKCAFSHFLTQSPRRTDGPTDGWTDKASYRVACSQLKMIMMSKGRPCCLQVVSVLY